MAADSRAYGPHRDGRRPAADDPNRSAIACECDGRLLGASAVESTGLSETLSSTRKFRRVIHFGVAIAAGLAVSSTPSGAFAGGLNPSRATSTCPWRA